MLNEYPRWEQLGIHIYLIIYYPVIRLWRTDNDRHVNKIRVPFGKTQGMINFTEIKVCTILMPR
jgi:hypothetical protein